MGGSVGTQWVALARNTAALAHNRAAFAHNRVALAHSGVAFAHNRAATAPVCTVTYLKGRVYKGSSVCTSFDGNGHMRLERGGASSNRLGILPSPCFMQYFAAVAWAAFMKSSTASYVPGPRLHWIRVRVRVMVTGDIPTHTCMQDTVVRHAVS